MGKPWNMYNSDKVAEISYATTQGLDTLVEKFRNSSVMLEFRDFRPKLYFSKDDGPFPDGRPRVGMEVAILDPQLRPLPAGEVGEICCRGPAVFGGYHGDPQATAKALRGGWFHTGDLATRDADGFYFIVDRKKDMIIRNGFNVYPREVEEVLYTHPAVAEAAVFGIPDPTHGEEVAALVTLKDGASATPEELRDFVADQIAAYKYPRVVRLGTLPKGPTGQILKREIKFDA